MSEPTRRSWVRPVLALAVLGVAAASLLIAPVGAHTNLSKGHVKFAHNADKVDQHHANAISRVAYDRVTNDALVGPATGTVVSATIVAPKKGFLEIVASSDVFGSSGFVNCWIEIGGVELDSTERSMELDAATNSEEDCATNGLQPVAKGTYTVELIGDPPTGIRFDEATMSVQFIPYNGVGTKSGSTAIVRPTSAHSNG